MLGSHPALSCPPEPWFLLRLSSVYAPSSHEGWFDDETATVATRAFLSPDVFVACARQFAAAAYNTHLQRSGRRIFVDKTPRYYHILEFLAHGGSRMSLNGLVLVSACGTKAKSSRLARKGSRPWETRGLI